MSDQEVKGKSLKSYDEAFAELKSFIIASRKEEAEKEKMQEVAKEANEQTK